MRTPAAVTELGRRQDSVVTTAQCEALGLTTSWVRRKVTSGQWQRLHRGVLVMHSGPVAWRSRARAALLYAGDGAAVSHLSAAYLHEFVTAAPRVIAVTVPHHRYVATPPGLVIHRSRSMPPSGGRLRRVHRGDTVLDIVGEARSADDAVALLCGAVRAGAHAAEILAAVDRRPRARGRALLTEILADVVAGVESPLERRYHRDVERRHGLPRGRLQQSQVVRGLWIRADCLYDGCSVRVELDGELAHPGGRTDADVWRDNAVLLARSEITLRYRWRHVRITPCATALQVADALRAGGWQGHPRPCGPHCAINDPSGQG